MNIAVRKTQFVRVLKERLFLRFHMSLILIGTALVGLLASKLLLLSLVTNIVIRCPLAVVVAYLAFFGFIKLWLNIQWTLLSKLHGKKYGPIGSSG